MRQFQEKVFDAVNVHNSLGARHEAFGELITQFQDMAFACAYAILGDIYLAEDVAQESFVIAWQKIEQLRAPLAFPAWLKRIVLSQCHRITRSRRLTVVPLEVSTNDPAPDPGPHVAAEKRELLTKVLTAIAALPDHERLVTTLFYINEYTQADIGEFLELPVSTVNKRLYSARQRLKGSLVDLFKDNLRRQRPSNDAGFSNKVKANLRQLTKTDWSAVSSMAGRRESSDVSGNDLWLNKREEFDDTRYFRRQYVAETPGKKIIGYGCIEQSIYLPRYRMFLVTSPALLRLGVGDLLLEQLTKDLLEAGAITVSCREYSSQADLLSFLKTKGFVEIATVMDCRLNVSEANDDSWEEHIEKLKQQGLSITTLANERERDPECVQKLYELNVELANDDPVRAGLSPPAYDAKEALMWLEMPYVLPNAYFIARDGNRYVGSVELSSYQAMEGSLTLGDTGVLRNYRRRGIGLGLMASAIEYAKRHNFQTIQSFNKLTQTSLLALNERVGFRVHFEHVTLEKCLRKISEVDQDVYERLTGCYRGAENGHVLDITIRNERGRLSAEFAGQKVELFPTNANSYFIKQFYGEISFVESDNGQVELIELREPRTNQDKIVQARKIE